MILVADGGSTKVDWVAIDSNKNEVFKANTLSLNPNVVSSLEIKSRIENNKELKMHKDLISQIYFYGAGLGTSDPTDILKKNLQSFFLKATKIVVEEDILGAAYATAKNQEAIVCILGTGSNSCFYNGKTIEYISPSLGYIVMDEASGNYFGKQLLRDYFYKKMPKYIADAFCEEFDLSPNTIKFNLYQVDNPNKYLASYTKFMFKHKEKKYIKKLVKKGFDKFFKYHVLNYKKSKDTPVFFVGSIAYYFKNLLTQVAEQNNINISGIVAKPIDNLIEYHKRTTI
ncbi:MAG: N-acetylglucosamine kinase [Tenacibaculum sp.]